MARLKVFVTSDGFTDYVVAATSRPKALAAWGVRQDVFKEGQAHETDDPALVKAATAQPGEVLRRPAGSRKALAKVKARAPEQPDKAEAAARRKAEAAERRRAAQAAKLEAVLAKLEAERTALDLKIDRTKADLSAARRAPG